MMNAKKFALPQSRPRVYMFYFKASAGDPEKINVEKFQDISADKCRTRPTVANCRNVVPGGTDPAQYMFSASIPDLLGSKL